MGDLRWHENEDGSIEARKGRWIATVTAAAPGFWGAVIAEEPPSGKMRPGLELQQSVEAAKSVAEDWIYRHTS